ncbi:MAG TPA: diguanylate cyclase [Usitatibacteraceae bacterium]|nr:diguanylate cyclase [Usitatibacteraceae bacterium]
MKFYKLLNWIPWFRDNHERKLGLVLFLATQATLLAYLAIKALSNDPVDLGIVFIGTIFNVGSWGAAYLAMRLYFLPVEHTSKALRNYLERQPAVALPADGKDLIGQLMRDAEYLGRRYAQDTAELQRSVDDDVLTGLYTRSAAKRRLSEDVARSERGQMTFHFVFVSLHGLTELGREHGNERVDALLQHVATLLSVNSRRSDWVARWSEHVFAIGYCDNNKIVEAVTRLHGIVENSPFEIAPNCRVAPRAACGAVMHARGLDVKAVFEMAQEALREAERGLASDEAAKRIHVNIPAPVIDTDLKELMR